ncbi:hypothetical protein WJX73_001435 [Symbiochloris irregularis]|uniref:Uncharacterized protein n=1 Tax=Symbiochloris irregularis TaxID=706552 RepID=A0AAW1P670_9CHLO
MARTVVPRTGDLLGCRVLAFESCPEEAAAALEQGFAFDDYLPLSQAPVALSAVCGGCQFLVDSGPDSPAALAVHLFCKRVRRGVHDNLFLLAVRQLHSGSLMWFLAVPPDGRFLGYVAREEELNAVLRHASPDHFPGFVLLDLDHTLLHAIGYHGIEGYMKELESVRGEPYADEVYHFCGLALEKMEEMRAYGRVWDEARKNVVWHLRQDEASWFALDKSRQVHVVVYNPSDAAEKQFAMMLVFLRPGLGHFRRRLLHQDERHGQREFVVFGCTAAERAYGETLWGLVNQGASLYMPGEEEYSFLSTDGQYPKYVGAAAGIVSQQEAWAGATSCRNPFAMAIDDSEVWAKEGITQAAWKAGPYSDQLTDQVFKVQPFYAGKKPEHEEKAELDKAWVVISWAYRAMIKAYMSATEAAERILDGSQPHEPLLETHGIPFEGFPSIAQLIEEVRGSAVSRRTRRRPARAEACAYSPGEGHLSDLPYPPSHLQEADNKEQGDEGNCSWLDEKSLVQVDCISSAPSATKADLQDCSSDWGTSGSIEQIVDEEMEDGQL